MFLICSLSRLRSMDACRVEPRPRGDRNATPTRFNLKERVIEGEWLDQVEALDGVRPRRTTVTIEHPKSILTRNNSPDIGFDRSTRSVLAVPDTTSDLLLLDPTTRQPTAPQQQALTLDQLKAAIRTALQQPGQEKRQ